MQGQVFYMSMDEGATLVDLPEESSTRLGKDTKATVQNRMHHICFLVLKSLPPSLNDRTYFFPRPLLVP
jgi:hypothetical protein